MLGSIAWRTPPRDYGPWERVAGLIADRTAPTRCRRHALRDARLDHPGSPRRRRAARLFGGSGATDAIWEALHVSHALARSDEFDSSTTISTGCRCVRGACACAARDDRSRLLRCRDPAGVLSARVALVSISFADRAPGLSTCERLPRGRPDELPFDSAGGEGLVALRPHPSRQGNRHRDRDRGAIRPPARDLRDRARRGVLPRVRRAACRRRSRHVSRAGRPGEARRSPRLSLACFIRSRSPSRLGSRSSRR